MGHKEPESRPPETKGDLRLDLKEVLNTQFPATFSKHSLRFLDCLINLFHLSACSYQLLNQNQQAKFCRHGSINSELCFEYVLPEAINSTL